MEVRILGTVDVVDDEGFVLEPGPKERLVLGRLALAGGRAVPTEELVHAVWRVPPATAHKTLQGHIHRLRRALGPSKIRLDSNGYRLTGVDVDAYVVEDLVRQAAAAFQSDDAEY